MASTTVIMVIALLATVSLAFDGSRLRDVPVEKCLHGGELKNGECECTLNWTGKQCDVMLCLNGGRPSLDRDRYTRCSCPYGLTGSRCESATKCDNGKLVEGKCECEPGFVGVFCQSRPCHNGTPTLIPGLDEYQCTCDIGYIGSFCDTKLVCLNGGSVSADNACVCAGGFSGDDCSSCEHVIEGGRCVLEVYEQSVSNSSDVVEWHLIAVGGGTLLVVILLVCAVYFALRSWRTKPSRVSSAQGSAIVPNPEGTDV